MELSHEERANDAGRPPHATPAGKPMPPILGLQTAAGNRAVTALIAAGRGVAILRQVPPATTTAAPGAGTVAAPTAQQQADHDTVVAEHKVQQQRINTLVAAGQAGSPGSAAELDRSTLFRNSCQWIASGRVTVRVLTATHDLTTRQPGRRAFFDKAVHYPDVGGAYSAVPDASDDAHVLFTAPGWEGGMSRHVLDIINPVLRTDEELKSTIIHEVQHDADETGFGEPGASRGAPGLTGSAQLQSAGKFNNYQTEFRAHWIETNEGSPGDPYGSSHAPASNSRPVPGPPGGGTPAATPTAFANERQEKIFWSLVRNGYGYETDYVGDPAFKQMVDAFERPTGVNLVNSIRVRALIDAVVACSPTQAVNDPLVRAALAAADALDSHDLAFLRSPDAATFWDQASSHLPAAVVQQLRGRGSPPAAGSVPAAPAGNAGAS
jgi:hypothetical protein